MPRNHTDEDIRNNRDHQDAQDDTQSADSTHSASSELETEASSSQADVSAEQAQPETNPTSLEQSLALRIKELEGQANQERDLRLRQQAEFENYKKRTAREQQEQNKYVNAHILELLIDVSENLNRALEHVEPSENKSEPLSEGISMVVGQLESIFEKFNLEKIDSLHKPFDPALHEAMGLIESNEHQENTVLEQYRAGYKLYDRIIRPAMVLVSKASDAASDVAEKTGSEAVAGADHETSFKASSTASASSDYADGSEQFKQHEPPQAADNEEDKN